MRIRGWVVLVAIVLVAIALLVVFKLPPFDGLPGAPTPTPSRLP